MLCTPTQGLKVCPVARVNWFWITEQFWLDALLDSSIDIPNELPSPCIIVTWCSGSGGKPDL